MGKQIYEVDIKEVKENILLELGRYMSTKTGYSRKLFESNILEILEQGYKTVPPKMDDEN